MNAQTNSLPLRPARQEARDRMQRRREMGGKPIQQMSTSEFITMQLFRDYANASADGRVYLEDIAEKLNLSIRSVTDMVSKLQRKGLLRWESDRKQRKGSYITLTEDAAEAATEQSALFENVIRQYGEEAFRHLVNEFTRLESMLDQQASAME